MTTWLLRCPGGEIPLAGVCVIGRSTDCEISIDDPNASRRHAELRVVGPDVIVKDLESRNGTHVDGRLIGSPTKLAANSRIIIGNTVMTLIAAPLGSRGNRTPVALATASLSDHTNTSVPDRAMLARAHAMLDAGHFDECAGGAAIVMRRQSALGARAEDEFVRGVSALLVALTQRSGDRRWLEGLFQVNTDCDRMLAPELVAAIEGLAPPGSVRLLGAYVEKMSARAATLSPADRVLLARLERLAT